MPPTDSSEPTRPQYYSAPSLPPPLRPEVTPVQVPEELRIPFASTPAGEEEIGTHIQHDCPVGATTNSGLPIVPGYEIVGELARGGMGVVFTACDLSLAREVAIKTLLPEFSNRSDLVAQFNREARIMARVQQPGVPPIHAIGNLADGRPFLVMKLIRGRTLREELDKADGPGALPRLLGVFEQICHTVGFAHSVGIIHRDLKPLNVMVGAFGEVQVMDWGLARELHAGGGIATGEEKFALSLTRIDAVDPTPCTGATRTGRAKGTASYMPPEQAKGEWNKVDTRADVFALGGILCTILTGDPPYTGDNPQAVLNQAIVADQLDALARLKNCGADAELISLCERCLNPFAENRPANGKVVADEVAAYRAGLEERARKAATDRAVAEARAEEAAHGHALAYCTLASALQDKSDLPGAIAAYREAIRLDANFAPAFSNLGVALHDSGDLPGAIEAYQQALRLAPEDASTHANLGVALHDSDDLPGAIAAYREALRLDPTDAKTHNTLGVALQTLGHVVEAIIAFRDAVEYDPLNPLIHTNLASAYLQGRYNAEAIVAAREAIRLNPLIPNADIAHGIVQIATGDVASGRAALAEAVRLDPKRWEPLYCHLFPQTLTPPPRQGSR